MPRSLRATVALTAGIALMVVACGESGPADQPTTAPATVVATTAAPTTVAGTAGGGEVPAGAEPGTTASTVASALDGFDHPSFPEPLIDPAAIFPGGPPPDGIPPIDEPAFVSVEQADAYLQDQEPVVVLEIEGDARAYPVQILVWHEIVNDTVGGVPVAITYCPLCNSAVSYRREVGGDATTFGTSGLLYHSALVMYDRATETLWTHFDGRAVVGMLAGEQLEPIGSPLLAWRDFASAYPDGRVLDRDRTGHTRAYGTNPYAGYDDPDGVPFLFRGDADDRARAMQRVVGIAEGEASIAYPLDLLSVPSGSSVTEVVIGERRLVILWSAGQSTALESSEVAAGRDVGSVGVFVPAIDGEPVALEAHDGGFVDGGTGSRWTVAGTAVEGPLTGRSLERVPHLDTFWFAWSTYRPGTRLVQP